jgi:hypothetical protein
MEDRLNRMEEEISQIKSGVKEIRDGLLGSEFTGPGAIHTLREHHARLNALEKQLERGKWLVIGLSAGTGGFLWELIKTVIK